MRLVGTPFVRHTGLRISEIALLPPHLLGVLGQGWHLELTELQRLGLESRDHARYSRVRSMRKSALEQALAIVGVANVAHEHDTVV